MPEQVAIREFEVKLAAERTRLVLLCARLTSDWDVAEGLAQETLFETWRARDSLRETDEMSLWLSAIVCYVCLRHVRKRQGTLARSARVVTVDTDAQQFFVELPVIDDEPGLTLEHGEIAAFLNKALTLVCPELRHTLVACYIHDLPLSKIAALPAGGMAEVVAQEYVQ